MVFKGLLDSINKDKKRKQAIKAAKRVAIGVGIAALAAVAGVATGILVAPKSGKETRGEMKGYCKQYIGHPGDCANRCQEGAEECSGCGNNRA